MFSLAEYKTRVDSDIAQEYDKAIHFAGVIDSTYADLLREMAQFIGRGGKRIRPYLAYLAYSGFGGTDTTAITKAGSVLEIFHNFLLIHDDIIDRDLVRYGGPTVEGVYLHQLRASSAHQPEHGALSAALLAGDVANSLAHAITYDLPVSDSQKLRILRALTDATFVVGGGEFIDSLGSVLLHQSLTKQQINAVYLHKTACYSFFLPFQVAAILTSQSKEVEEQLRALAIPIGIAYQMRDDYLGLFGETATTGKPITSDVREGKQTLYYALMQERCSEQQRVELDQIYGNSQATEREVLRVREICLECGAADEVEQSITSLYEQAMHLLESMPLSSDSKTALQEIFNKSITRHD